MKVACTLQVTAGVIVSRRRMPPAAARRARFGCQRSEMAGRQADRQEHEGGLHGECRSRAFVHMVVNELRAVNATHRAGN